MSEKITVRCACGGKFVGTSNPSAAVVAIAQTFGDLHSDEGCREVDAAEYKRIMARLRREGIDG